ncbi:MAG: methyltransferase domain-containing protein [Candidatus Pacearchaeota archaeon]
MTELENIIREKGYKYIEATKPYSENLINYARVFDELADILKEGIKGKKVIDIGCGNPLNAENYAKFLMDEIGAESYTGVDAFINNDIERDKIKFIRKDALSYLSKQSNESAVVTANGILVKEVISDERYMKSLIKEIYRIVPRDGIFVAVCVDEPKIIEKQGFRDTFSGNISHSINIYKKQ